MGSRPRKSPPVLALVLRRESHALRRRLGPLAWAALETLALGAEPRGENWIAIGGLRALAEDLGVNKDTAGRAVGQLEAAGLVTRERLSSPDPARRSAYRLRLPQGVELSSPNAVASSICPENQDSTSCPITRDSAVRPERSDNTMSTAGGEHLAHDEDTHVPKPITGAPRKASEPEAARRPAASRRQGQGGGRRRKADDEAQGRLFDFGVSA